MDHGAFDKLARLLGSAGSRRAALGALLGTSLAGTLGVAEAAKKKNRGNERNKSKDKAKKSKGGADVSAQAADCLSPGPSSNMNGCNFEGEDFSGDDLSGSSMVNTIFRNADLVETDLFSSNMRGANFRGANLCGADLSSSTLRNADFRGFAPFGRSTNLAFADLSSSACGGLLTNQFTFICGTTWCDGTIRNDSCPTGVPSDLCCTPCGAGEACIDNECRLPTCDEPPSFTSCDCESTFDGGEPACVSTLGICDKQACTSNGNCGPGEICARSSCGSCTGQGRCVLPCEAECTCVSVPGSCADSVRCTEVSSAARRSGSDAGQKYDAA